MEAGRWVLPFQERGCHHGQIPEGLGQVCGEMLGHTSVEKSSDECPVSLLCSYVRRSQGRANSTLVTASTSEEAYN